MKPLIISFVLGFLTHYLIFSNFQKKPFSIIKNESLEDNLACQPQSSDINPLSVSLLEKPKVKTTNQIPANQKNSDHLVREHLLALKKVMTEVCTIFSLVLVLTSKL